MTTSPPPDSPRGADRAFETYRQARDTLLAGHRDPATLAGWQFPDVGPRFNWAHDWFDRIARDNHRSALVIADERGARHALTFDQLAHRSDQVASFLWALGLRPGDPVLMMLNNQVELWEFMLGAMKIGAVLIPTTSALGPADVTDRLARGEARAVICNRSDTAKFTAAPADLVRISVGPAAGWSDVADARDIGGAPPPHPGTAASDPLLWYFTSGTTNLPKLVEHTQVSYPVGHLSTMYWLGLRPGDVHCNISSPGWGKHAWSSFFAPFIAEATVFVSNYTRFDPARLLTQLRTERVTTLCAPPTVWRMLINADLSGGPGTLREVASAGEPLNPEVIAQVRRHWGITVRDGYGQTETTACVGNPPGRPVSAGSMGRPLPGVPVVVVDVATGTPVGAPGEGELCLDLARRPLSLMTGYRGDPERNAEATAGGRYHTGDVVSMGADGTVTFIGRTDDVFKSSDYKISPFEVESILIEHPAVAEAAVVPSPHPLRLCVPKAYVTLAPGHHPGRQTAQDILAFARSRLAPYQRIRRLEFSELPKTISGKIRRVELRARGNRRDEWAAADGDEGPEWREEDFPDLGR